MRYHCSFSLPVHTRPSFYLYSIRYPTTPTGEWKLQGPWNDFERNKLGIYRVAAKRDIGELTSITVRHNNYWPLAGWFLENVEVENVVTQKSREFPCHRWLARDEDGGVIQRELEAVPEGCEPVRYKIRVRTGDFDRAATMARVYITLNGTLGSSGEYEFVDMREAFMEGQKGELLMVRAKDLGEITSIRVRHDNSWLNPEWYLKDIRIENQNDKRVWYFPHEDWIGKAQDDTNERTIYPITGRDDALKYRLRVRTGDVPFAGTDANVYVTLNGIFGSTDEHKLDNTGNDFEKGKTDVFTITQARDVGEILSLRIRHDNFGLFPGWYLKYIRVTRVNDEKVWYFPCEQWLEKKADGCIDLTLTPGREPDPEKKGGEEA